MESSSRNTLVFVYLILLLKCLFVKYWYVEVPPISLSSSTACLTVFINVILVVLQSDHLKAFNAFKRVLLGLFFVLFYKLLLEVHHFEDFMKPLWCANTGLVI